MAESEGLIDHTGRAGTPEQKTITRPLIEDIKRKDFIAVKSMDLSEAMQPRFQQKVETAFKAATPLMQFLCKAVGVPY